MNFQRREEQESIRRNLRFEDYRRENDMLVADKNDSQFTLVIIARKLNYEVCRSLHIIRHFNRKT